MKALLFFFFLLLLINPIFAQRGNNWVFGEKAWINFSTQPPTAGTSGMSQLEGCSSISDLNGNLLFYSDGTKVWNAQHQVMPNGTGLFGHFSSTQSSMIVPFPADPQRYYLFTMDVIGGSHGLSYSVVNMSLDNGKGDLESKNTFLIGPSSEKVTSVNHCNGKDVWVMTAITGSDKFFAYLVTATGVSAPVISTIGASIPYFSIGYLKFSPDGTKLACANVGTGLDLFDFDAATGLVTNQKKILSGNNQHTYGIEFSPNSKLMYVANIVRINGTDSRFDVSQYAQLDADQATIGSTRFELDNFYLPNIPVGFAVFSAIQLGPDRRVHIADFFGSLHVVNKPDRVGASCDYLRAGIPLASGTYSRYGLPDFNQSYFKGSFTYDISCTDNEVNFYFARQSNASGLIWDFGDPASGVNNSSTIDSPIHVFTNPGVYEVKVISFLSCRNDTLSKTINVGPLLVNLDTDKSICGNDPYTIIPQVQGTPDTYLWQDNTVLPTYTTNTSGLYWVEIKNNESGCIARDSLQLNFQSYPLVDLGIDTAICERATYLLDAGNPGATYTWQDNSHQQIYTATRAGIYHVKVNMAGCESSDSIILGVKYLPRVYLGNDTAICGGMTIQLQPALNHAEGAVFLWNTGEIEPVISVTQPGIYSLSVSNVCGTVTDGIIVKQGVCRLYVPTGFTPNNDGKNDIFKPGYGENVTDYSMEIYNRWGEKVFTSSHIYKGWDGRLRGILQPAGVYTWLIRYKIFNDARDYAQKGTLMMIY